jgi:ankyrin repeat protein
MSKNPFRQLKVEGYTNGFENETNADGRYVAPLDTQALSGLESYTPREESKDMSPDEGSNCATEYQQRALALSSTTGDHVQMDQHADPFSAHNQTLHQANKSHSQPFSNPFVVESLDSNPLPPHARDQNQHHYADGNTQVSLPTQFQQNGRQQSLPDTTEKTSQHHLSSDHSLPEVSAAPPLSSSTQRNGNHDESLAEAAQGLGVHHKSPEILVQPRHAHVPSSSQIRKESLPSARPTYIRALSSHIPESVAPTMTAGDAHAEVLRRLGKAEKTVKTLKRRGSNESLSSLISYSIRRPSISTRPESGYSLDALAAVLEDVAQDGNLALVQAVMALGANPNFRSVNRLKNRRHDALNKATAAGHVDIIDYLLRQGATFNLGESQKRNAFTPIDYKLLNVIYSGYGDVARYLISNQGANPFTQQWPREYHDANRTVYRRVVPAKVYQRTVLDALSRMGDPEQDSPLLNVIMHDTNFNPSAISTCIYTDSPFTGDDTRMVQTTTHYSALSAFIKAGWSSAVETMLTLNPDPSAYQHLDTITSEEGQIPSSNIQRYIYPANALTKDTWMYRPNDALRILRLLIDRSFNTTTAQRTPDDSAPRTPLGRAILANAASAVEVLLHAHPDLVSTDISFRLLLPGGEEREYVAQPLAAAIIQGSLECAQVLLRNGASPIDPAFSYRNVLCFAAGHGGSTGVGLLEEMVGMKPELLGEAMEVAILKARAAAVEVLVRCKGVGDLKIWDMVLGCPVANKDEDFERRYLRVIDLVNGVIEKVRPSSEAVRIAIEQDNIVGVDQLLSLGILESREVVKWCGMGGKRGKWDEMLRKHVEGEVKGKY